MKMSFLRQTAIAATFLWCAVLSSCESYRLKNEYKEKHEKYRTLMYRSNFKQCFVDSCSKYGTLYREIMGWGAVDVNAIDTVTINDHAVCK